ncbi:hypothetical protein DB346_12135 [Verrucomicrobia bacterium LW23]|nr:hypothetical protein DB346_12135 [Verrucomicrobia bacterium LW23]
MIDWLKKLLADPAPPPQAPQAAAATETADSVAPDDAPAPAPLTLADIGPASHAPRPPAWPKGVPVLYPGQSQLQQCQFLTEAEYDRIWALPRALVLPFVDDASDEDETLMGIGLQLLFIRDLRVHPGLSLLGPEDSTDIPLQDLDVQSQEFADQYIMGGRIRLGKDYQARVSVGINGQFTTEEIAERDFHRFLTLCVESLLRQAGLDIDDALREKWKTGRPGSPMDLINLGKLAAIEAGLRDIKGEYERINEFYSARKYFTLHLHVREDDTVSVEDCIAALEVDPYDVQTLFILSNKLRQLTNGEAASFQYLRRAMEIAPGFGKAHMLANDTAPLEANLYLHSELGRRLLPNNAYAVQRHIEFHVKRGLVPQDPNLAYEPIRIDSQDAAAYWTSISLLQSSGRMDEAMEMLLKLKKLVTPPMSERTLQCYRRDPVVAIHIQAGSFNPVADVDSAIEALKARMNPPGEAEDDVP